MPQSSILFNHVHLVCREPEATVRFFIDKLGGEEVQRAEVQGAPQMHVKFNGATVIIRGQRTGEKANPKGGLEWGIDHFAFSVEGDFDAYCDEMKSKGVKFTMDPVDFNPTTRIAFIQATDDVSIELVQRIKK
ncbi:MAG: VOC family protein [bacterium]|nr:VOC family protein [bacterium]